MVRNACMLEEPKLNHSEWQTGKDVRHQVGSNVCTYTRKHMNLFLYTQRNRQKNIKWGIDIES